MENQRVDKNNYYLDIAETVIERGTCLRRNFGAIIVKNDEIVSTGYTGAPRGRETVAPPVFAYVKSWLSPVAKGMSFAVASMPRQTAS